MRQAAGAAETGAAYDVLDARDEAAVEAHAASVVERAGPGSTSPSTSCRVETSTACRYRDVDEDSTRPVVQGIACQSITARAAARRMTAQGSGVILSLNSASGNGSPMMGGTGAAHGAIDALIRPSRHVPPPCSRGGTSKGSGA
ncbi:hypothetical protein ACFWDI_08610 [Streptomyces sp. NPDC060064]|uniref:hypothetical protein n=1 Tax=Streptomyces sp. NPDC060064 TaxID=3347049 RepID=UPI0036BE8089